MSTKNVVFGEPPSPIVKEDLAEICCNAYNVKVMEDRPCFILRGVFSKQECMDIIKAVESKHDKEPVSMIPGTRSQFACRDSSMSNIVWERVKEFFPETLDNGTVVGLQTIWRHAKYFPGQSVFGHMDFRHADENDPCIASRVSFTVYLNDSEFSGGETTFVKNLKLDGSFDTEIYSSIPQAGSVIVFYQSVPEFSHCAKIVKNGCKSIMRADVMYKFPSSELADPGALRL